MFDTKRFAEGVALFDAGEFFAAHEALEDVWRGMRGPERRFLQGLVQLAVALHHHSTGNVTGARSVLARAAGNLAGAPEDLFGLALPALQVSVRQWERALKEGSRPPPLPFLQRKPRC